MADREVTLSIFRFDPEKDKEGRFVDYKVPTVEGMVVLDAVRYVQEKIDTTLAIRWNCKAARCGSCSAEINNRPALMCKTRIDTLGDRITVAPMRAFPVIRDLVTDVDENYRIMSKIPKFTVRKELMNPEAEGKKHQDVWRIQQINVERAKEFKKCIECFLCQDVCHVVREHKSGYFGPRHIVKAASLDMHPLDIVNRAKFLNEEGGLGYCNITKCCQEVCPEHIHITDNAIIPEKERAVDLQYDPLMHAIKRRLMKKRGETVA
ncbi:fumarate reductase iron-sulfur subunit [Thermogymnomonas acidicola]|uniref:Fumarate reductase iron-sulfur subunit n=1 Tax=Thermogymnomonas acidicola TaxID=399579 RepID=A0AA37F9K5_9ARCH|nr:succinate dehydrogenase/fumarate reductase iron-sulfur subunit [Thermogymnomonas acidicola]GGM73839.1 fumarate reductase iron-sulfur subunit [Thermogymnomonas acidicola]